jgi:exosortase E/protease (VPEID-CTERM system)
MTLLSRYLPQLLIGRLYLLAAILAAECLLTASVPHAGPLLGPLAPAGIVSFAVVLGLGYSRLNGQREQLSFNFGLFWAHIACVSILVLGNLAALHHPGANSGPWFNSWLNSLPVQLVSGAVLLIAVVLLAQACIPLKVWTSTARKISPVGQYAALTGLVALLLQKPLQNLWSQSSAANVYVLQTLTFRSVQALLGLFLPDLVADPGPAVIGTERFSIVIAPHCSGIEGLGLVLVFTTVWLWFFRKENRFPHALLLIPCALVCAFSLNILRIATLILIGNAGAPEVAFVGFHSQAGWIAFTVIALGFSMATQKLAWVRKSANPTNLACGHASGTEAITFERAGGESPQTSAYLIPFLAIMGATFISKSASGHFEWLYPLRFVAAAIALWMFRHEYRKLNWRFGWAAPLTGAGIFLIWIAPEWWTHPVASPLGSALAALSPAGRTVWIAFRVAAAVATVPIAEELAFRGYLARRLMAREFDEVPFAHLTLISIGLSSIVFGLMHGQLWVQGIAAGLAYALLIRSKERMGDAVVAHAVSNLLLAAWVLARGDWGQW